MQYKEKTFTKEDLLKLKTRRIIYRFILENPGLHLRELVRRLNIPVSTLIYHLRYIEKREIITVKHELNYSRYYAANKLGKEEEDLIKIFRFDTARNIIFYMLIVGTVSQIELSRELKKHPTTIEFNLKKLMDFDIIEPAPISNKVIRLNSVKKPFIVERDKTGREKFFIMKNLKLYDLLITYCDKNHDDVAESFFSYIENMQDIIQKGFPTKQRTFQQAVDEIEKTLYDVFPLPFCC